MRRMQREQPVGNELNLSHLLIPKWRHSSFGTDFGFSSKIHRRSALHRKTCCKHICKIKVALLLVGQGLARQ